MLFCHAHPAINIPFLSIFFVYFLLRASLSSKRGTSLPLNLYKVEMRTLYRVCGISNFTMTSARHERLSHPKLQSGLHDIMHLDKSNDFLLFINDRQHGDRMMLISLHQCQCLACHLIALNKFGGLCHHLQHCSF